MSNLENLDATDNKKYNYDVSFTRKDFDIAFENLLVFCGLSEDEKKADLK